VAIQEPFSAVAVIGTRHYVRAGQRRHDEPAFSGCRPGGGRGTGRARRVLGVRLWAGRIGTACGSARGYQERSGPFASPITAEQPRAQAVRLCIASARREYTLVPPVVRASRCCRRAQWPFANEFPVARPHRVTGYGAVPLDGGGGPLADLSGLTAARIGGRVCFRVIVRSAVRGWISGGDPRPGLVRAPAQYLAAADRSPRHPWNGQLAGGRQNRTSMRG